MAAVLELEVATRVYGHGNPRESCVVPFPRPRLLLRDLIAQKVRVEVERLREGHNRQRPLPLSLRYLTSEDVPWAGGGAVERPAPPRVPEPDEEIERALDAFREGRLFVLVDGSRLDDLDEIVELTPKTRIQFIRILPLVGGRC